MTIRMLDSIFPQNLPPGADAYAGYVDGSWQTAPVLKARFPGAHILTIAAFPTSDAQCLDVEPGDATNGQAPAWVRRQHRRGETRPCVYTSASNMGALAHTLTAEGIKRSQVRLWSAHYGLGPHICSPATCAYPGCPPCDGTQYTDTARGARGTLIDASVLADDFFGGDVAISKADIAAIASAVWSIDGIVGAPQPSPGNPFWTPHRVLTDTGERIRELEAALEAATAALPTVEAIAAAVIAALPPAGAGGLTQADVQAAVAAAFRQAFSPPGA